MTRSIVARPPRAAVVLPQYDEAGGCTFEEAAVK